MAAGNTPMMLYGLPSNATVWCRMLGSPPNRVCHRESLITMTGLPDGCPSSGRKKRPSCGLTPSTSKKFADTLADGTCNGSPCPVRLKLSLAAAATPENDWLWSCTLSNLFKLQQCDCPSLLCTSSEISCWGAS